MTPRYDNYGQIQGPRGPIGDAHPLLVVGIIIFILPFFGMIPGVSFPGWLRFVGIVIIIIGAILSIAQVGDRYL